MAEESTHIILFKGKEIRRIIRDDEWWFSVVDIIAALTDSNKPRDYWYRMKKREQESSGVDLSTFCRQLKLPAEECKEVYRGSVSLCGIESVRLKA